MFRGVKGRIQGGICRLCDGKDELEGDAIGARYILEFERFIQVVRWILVKAENGRKLAESELWQKATHEMTDAGIVPRGNSA